MRLTIIFFFFALSSAFGQGETKVSVEQIETIRAQDVQVVSGTFSGASVLNALETLKALDDDDLDKSSTNELQQLTENQNFIGLTNSSVSIEKIIRDGNNGFYYLGPVNFNSSKVLFVKNTGTIFLRNAAASTRISLRANDDEPSTFVGELFVGTSNANFSSEKFAVDGNIFITGDYFGYAGRANARSPLSQNIITVDSAFTEVIEELQNSADGDGDPTNELQHLSLNGTNLEIEDGNSVDLSALQDGVNDADANPTNEIQSLTLSSTEIGLTGSSQKVPRHWRSGGNGITYSLPGTNTTSKFYFFESVGKMGWRNAQNGTRILLSAEDDEFSWIFNNFQVGSAAAISNEKFSVSGNIFATGNFIGYAGTARATNPLTGATNQNIDAVLTEMNANSVSYFDYNSIQNSINNNQGAYLGINKTSPEYAADIRSTGSEQFVSRFQSNVNDAKALLIRSNALYSGFQLGESDGSSTNLRLYSDRVGIGVKFFNAFFFTDDRTFVLPKRTNTAAVSDFNSIYSNEIPIGNSNDTELRFVSEQGEDKILGFAEVVETASWYETNNRSDGKRIKVRKFEIASIGTMAGAGIQLGLLPDEIPQFHAEFRIGTVRRFSGGGDVALTGGSVSFRQNDTGSSFLTVFNGSTETITDVIVIVRVTE